MAAQVQFNDGDAYERYMGVWSALAGEAFLRWLEAKPGGRWLDVGCGSGAFTELIFKHAAPARAAGIDPSEPQLAFARRRFASRPAQFLAADAMALPFPDASFDAAVMPLVIFFVPEPAQGVAEMARVVAPGGLVAAYAWDMPGGGFPYAPVREQLAALGHGTATEPHPDVSTLDAMSRLWRDAGLEEVETREIEVRRTYDSFDDYWATAQGGPSFSAKLKTMPPEDVERLRERLRQRLPAGEGGRITCAARANAVKGRTRR